MDNNAMTFGGNYALASGGWQAGSTNTQPSNSAAIPFTVNGVYGSRSITAAGYPWVQANPGGFQPHVGGTTRLYAVLLDSAANVSMTQGPAVDTARLAAGIEALQFPPIPRDRVCAGFVRVALTGGANFTPGTDPLTTAGNRTTSFINAMICPPEPLRS